MPKLTRGECFKDARLVHNQHGWQSMEEVYTQTGVSASMIKDLEDDDKIRSVGYDKVVILAKHYGVSTDYLLGLSTYPKVANDFDRVCEYTGLSKKSVKYLSQLREMHNLSYSFDNWDILDVLNTLLENDAKSKLLENTALLMQLNLKRNRICGAMRPSGTEDSISISDPITISTDDICAILLNKIETALFELRDFFSDNIQLDVIGSDSQ